MQRSSYSDEQISRVLKEQRREWQRSHFPKPPLAPCVYILAAARTGYSWPPFPGEARPSAPPRDGCDHQQTQKAEQRHSSPQSTLKAAPEKCSLTNGRNSLRHAQHHAGVPMACFVSATSYAGAAPKHAPAQYRMTGLLGASSRNLTSRARECAGCAAKLIYGIRINPPTNQHVSSVEFDKPDFSSTRATPIKNGDRIL